MSQVTLAQGEWLVDVYMRAPLASLRDQSPADTWRKEIVGVDQMVPSRTVLLERLFFRKVEDRRLDHEGVEYDCLIYNSVDLGALRSQLGDVLKVTIWVSDEDLGHIQVCAPGSDIWIRVPCLKLDYASGFTRWQHNKCKKMKRVLADEGLDVDIATAREDIRGAVEAEAKELKQAQRKRRARFTEKDPDREDALGVDNSDSTDDDVSSDSAAPTNPQVAEPDDSVPELDSMVLD